MNQTYKVLIVDDSADDRFFLRIMLEPHAEFEIVGEARDGQEAIDLLNGANRFDLMFLDLKMPGKSGFDVLQWIQNQALIRPTVAVMSGSWLQEDITKSLSLGAHAYFKKSSLKEDQQKMISDLKSLLRERKDGSKAA